MITIQEFNECYEVVIVRFELYPAEEPSSWCVGYNIKNKNNQYSMFVDTTVPIDASKSNEDVLHDAWDQVKSNVTCWVKNIHCKSSLLNTQFLPTCLCE